MASTLYEIAGLAQVVVEAGVYHLRTRGGRFRESHRLS